MASTPLDSDSPRQHKGEKGSDQECCVCVAVHVRPLIDREIEQACQECLVVPYGQPQVRAALRPRRSNGVPLWRR